MSFGLKIDLVGWDRLEQSIRDQIRGLEDPRELLDQIGGLVETQTRNRIANEKKGPDGKKWEPWSINYAKTRHGNQSLLMGEGDLLDSIQYSVTKDQVEIGSNLIYAATHQYGDKRRAFGHTSVEIPARPYVGLSEGGTDEIMDVITDWFASL